MGKKRNEASSSELKDEQVSGAVDGGQSKVLGEGRVQKNEVQELSDGRMESHQEGVGSVAVEVNPERGVTGVEFPAVDGDGNTTVEHFATGMRHLVTAELADAQDPQGRNYFIRLEDN